MSTTPDMNMTLPDVNSTPGPTYASQINAALNVVDGHDHTPGFGTKVPTAGLNINTDLPFGGFSATGLLTAAFTSQTADPSGNSRVYFKNGEMYATDGSGNHVQITLAGNVNVGSVGAITGMGGTTATVSYSNVTKTFTFNQAANQTALMKVGDLVITDSSVTSGSTVTLKAPAGLASGYTLTAPTHIAAANNAMLASSTTGALDYITADGATLVVSTGVIGVPSSGIGTTQIANSAVTTAKIADGNVTDSKLSTSKTVVTSSSTGSYTNATTTPTTAATAASITTHGRPVMVMLQGDGTGLSFIGLTQSGGAGIVCRLDIQRDGVTIASHTLSHTIGAGFTVSWSPTAVVFLDTGATATGHVYSLNASLNAGTAGTIAITKCVLIAYEI